MNKVTYFTPTYNRAYLLPNLYDSLLRQTKKEFVWLIIDDGSTDNTKELVENWVKEKKIEIKYVQKKNGGKHTAIELSNKICETEYICCCDSDDFLSDDATGIIEKYIDKYSDDKEIVGFVGRRANYEGTPFNGKWTPENMKIYFNELAEKYGYSQDTVLIFKTDIIKNFHFPIFEDEKFVTEAVFYQQFLRDYKMITIQECIYLAEYCDDGYTVQGMNLFFKNPKGYLYWLRQTAFFSIQDKESFLCKIKKCGFYYAWKNVLKTNYDFKKDYKIKFPYNFLGNIAKFIILPKCKKTYKNYLKT